LRVLLADEDEVAVARMTAFIEAIGHEVISSATDLAETTEAIAREDPDLSMVLVHSDDEHALELIEEIEEYSSGPVIVLLGEDDDDFIAKAADRGVDAFVRPTSSEAVQSTIEIARRRHDETQRLIQKVEQLQTALERRSVIERAKGVLMERHSLPERAAFELLRSHARALNMTVVDLAHEVIGGRDLTPEP
jgi:AmiR/NasT family two-component response regulator